MVGVKTALINSYAIVIQDMVENGVKSISMNVDQTLVNMAVFATINLMHTRASACQVTPEKIVKQISTIVGIILVKMVDLA